jgi:hypothetical protein
MKKLLTICTILLVSTIWSTSFGAGTWFGKSVTGIDSISTSTGGAVARGFSRANYHTAMSTDGDLYILVWKHLGDIAQIYTVNDYDGTSPAFTCDNDVFDPIISGGTHDHMAVYAYGDSAFAYSSSDGATTYDVIRKYVNRTGGILDSIDGNSTTYGSRGGVNVTGDGKNLLVLHSRELASDSIYIFETNGALAQGSTYTNRGQRAKMGGGLRVPWRQSSQRLGGFLAWDVKISDLYIADTTGWATLTQTFTTGDMPDIGSQGENLCWMVPVVDSYFVVIYQDSMGVAAEQNVKARPFHFSTYSSVVYDAAATTLLAAGYIPGGFTAQPLLSKLPGTDSVIAIYTYWADTVGAAKANRSVAYRISGDKGVTWGNQADFTAPPAGRPVWRMQAPLNLARVGDSIRIALIVTDSVAVSPGDSAYVYLDNIVTTPAPVAAKRLILRK